jgi:multisubunit Na+/H+ antiporter MnhB subunit
VTSRFCQLGKTVQVFWKIIFGSTSSFGADPRFTLPVNALNVSGAGTYLTGAGAFDAGVGHFPGLVQFTSATTVYLLVIKTDGTYAREAYCSSTVPFTWTTNDEYIAQFSYEVA